jgi:hypothetical protein
MSEGHLTMISQCSWRNSTSMLSYAGSRSTAMEVVFAGSVGWTWLSWNIGLSRKPNQAGIDLRRVVCYDQFLLWVLIRLKRIYNFWCSMLVFTPFAYCFITLSGIFIYFPELTY